MLLKRLRRSILYPLIGLGIHSVTVILSCLSFAGLERLARRLAPVVVAVYPRGRKLVLTNLRIAFPDWTDERRAAVYRECVRHALQSFFEFLWFFRHPDALPGFLDKEIGDIKEIEATCHSPRGTMIITPHLGNYEVVAHSLAAWGVDLYAVVHPLRNPWVDRIATAGREYHGMRVIPQDGAVRGIVKVLRDGKSVAILMDQSVRPHKGGMFSEFFGLPVTVSRAPATLARKIKPDIVVAASMRENGKIIVIRRPLSKPVEDYASDEELTRELMAAQEDLIRRHPEQYAWLYQRWRYIPKDASPELASRYPYYARVYVAPHRRDTGETTPEE